MLSFFPSFVFMSGFGQLDVVWDRWIDFVRPDPMIVSGQIQ